MNCLQNVEEKSATEIKYFWKYIKNKESNSDNLSTTEKQQKNCSILKVFYSEEQIIKMIVAPTLIYQMNYFERNTFVRRILGEQ